MKIFLIQIELKNCMTEGLFNKICKLQKFLLIDLVQDCNLSHLLWYKNCLFNSSDHDRKRESYAMC